MHFVVDQRLLDETERYRLELHCESCVHFDEARESCSEEYPSEPHRRKSLQIGEPLWFCKHFELV
jgi:hypothetical protein